MCRRFICKYSDRNVYLNFFIMSNVYKVNKFFLFRYFDRISIGIYLFKKLGYYFSILCWRVKIVMI